MNRRKFLKILGISTAAIPAIIIAKELPKSIAKPKIHTMEDVKVTIGGHELKGYANLSKENNYGLGTKGLLTKKLLELPGVTKVVVLEDPSLVSTIECAVEGGSARHIALCIAYYLPFGIATTGLVGYRVQTLGRHINFSRFNSTVMFNPSKGK